MPELTEFEDLEAAGFLVVTAPSMQVVTLEVGGVDSDGISFRYTGLRDNLPATYNNTVYLWQDHGVSWDSEPIASTTLSRDRASGSGRVYATITEDEYTLGYAVGAAAETTQVYRNQAASAYLPSSRDPLQYVYESTQLTFLSVQSGTINLSYRALGGWRPKTDGAWAGVWRGNASYTVPPITDTPTAIPTDSDRGNFSLFTDIGRGNTYTVALFARGWDPKNAPDQNVMMATVTFTAPE
jgi:hypothetical protein